MPRPFCLLLILLPALLPAQAWRLEKLPSFINSQCDEITPVPSRDGRTLFFTRVGCDDFNRTLLIDSVDIALKQTPLEYIASLADVYGQIAGKPVYAPERAVFNQDIWVATADDSLANFNTLTHPGYPLNSALPNSVMTITPDPNTFYVINQFERNGNMSRGFSAVRRNADSTGWSFPSPIDMDDYYTIKSEVSLTMSFDGKVLILAAARFDSRDMDLYVCFRKGPNRWGPPQHLGNVINSEGRELTPFLSEDNETLYFSSNRSGVSGGNDIFKSRRLDDTWKNWSIPERLDARINSAADESQPYFNMTTGHLYFTSKRDGNSDIFRIQIEPPQETELTVIGRILLGDSRQLMPAEVRYSAESGDTINTLVSPNGVFRLKIPRGVRFTLQPQKTGYAGTVTEVLFPKGYYFFREQYVDLYLRPLEVGEKIELQPIFFQQSKAVILETSFPELERLAKLLLDNPKMQIRVEGHTDNFGKVPDLVRLSEDRARAIRDFLVGKGIATTRITTVGHGPKYPVTDNSTDALRAQNRRVEVRITKI